MKRLNSKSDELKESTLINNESQISYDNGECM